MPGARFSGAPGIRSITTNQRLPFFFGANPKPAESTGTIIDTSWPLSRAELFHPHRLAHYYDVNAEEEHVELRRYQGNPHGVTGTSMFMLLMYR